MASLLHEDLETRELGFEGWPREITDDVAYLRNAIVNVVFYGRPTATGRGDWVLIDAGLPGSASSIIAAAERRFGRGARPSAIVLTHGHFDHVGALEQLARQWDVPVYAHTLELPYLTGKSPYPPPDPSVGGGLMASLSFMYPRGPINLLDRVKPLPEDGSVPGMPGWKWVHTPGHSPGHVSLFRESDKTLIAGDAFVTVKQESALAVLSQTPEVHGPPAYYTPDWPSAWTSVETLEALRPERVITGHGLPMLGHELKAGLRVLAREFDRLAIPEHGRYVGHSAVADAHGVVSVPPDHTDPWTRVAVGLGFGLLAGVAIAAAVPSGRGRRS